MSLNKGPKAAATVNDGDTVKVHCTCKLEDGSVVDTTKGKEPLKFTVGNAEIMPGLQEALMGMSPGESKTQIVSPAKAYGPYHDQMTATLDRKLIPPEVKVEVGVSLRVKHSDGHESDAFVTELTDENVSVDGNHPLAGKSLILELELLERTSK